MYPSVRRFVTSGFLPLFILVLSLNLTAASPTITSLSPTSGAVGASVTITGTHFGNNQGTSTVKLNGTSATPTSWSGTSIVTPVPAGATTGNVVVTVSGVASNGVSFTVLPTPSITNLSPTSGAVGASVTITGTNFGATQGTSTVKFNGTAAAPTSWSATSIVVPVPTGATTGNVVVHASGVDSNGISFTVLPTPSITSLSPTSGAVGTSVTITGTNFGSTQGTSTVKFNGTAATPTSWSATSIVVPVPTGATTGNLVVHASGVDSNGISFTVLPTPSITSLSPTSGAVGTSVTITGTNFGSTQGTSTVTFSGTTATPTSWSATSIVTPVPAGAVTGNVVVAVSGVPSNGVTFMVLVPPSITSLSPTSGAVGDSISLYGTAFGSTQGTSTVTFNGVSATASTWTSTRVIARVPAGATSGPVVVTVGGTASNGASFTVLGTGTISGAVTRMSDGTALSGASVIAMQSGVTIASTSTAVNGTYSLGNLAPGSYDLQASASGYGTAFRPQIPAPAGGTTTLNVTLSNLTISSLSPSSGTVGTSVTIMGTSFGGLQNGSTVNFNGISASPTRWSDTTIVVPIPSGATTGPVTVGVGGASSNAVTFTVGTGGITGTVTSGANGSAISGALAELLQSNAVLTTTTTAADGTYSFSSLSPGSYDLRFSATSYGTTLKPGNSVTVSATTTVNASLPQPGTISGKVTRSDGVTAISGATVTILQNGTTAGTASTDTSGNYSVGTLSNGAYAVQATASGFNSKTQSGVTVTTGGATTVNFLLAIQDTVTYSYDEIGRLVGTVDALSDAVSLNLTYNYGWRYDNALGTGGTPITIGINPLDQYQLFFADLNIRF